MSNSSEIPAMLRIIPIQDLEGLREAAETMLDTVLNNPNGRKSFDLIVEDRGLDRVGVLMAGFVYGASFAIQEAANGAIREMPKG